MISLNALPLIYVHTGRSMGHPISATTAWLSILLPVVFTIFFFIYKYYRNKVRVMSWENGRVPKDFVLTENNIAEVFIVMAGSMTKRGKLLIRAKEAMVKKYIDEHFPKANSVVDESFDHVLWNSVDLVALISWCAAKLTSDQKLQLFEFVVLVAVSDNDLNDEERAMLLYVLGRFNLNHDLLSDRAKEAVKIENQEYVSGNRSTELKRSRFLRVLGLGENASDSEIKSMYRLLVKEVHPDRFPNATDEERRHYSARFQEIQEAYEFLTNA